MSHATVRGPRRIVCLTEKTTETFSPGRRTTQLTVAASARDRIIGDPQEVVRCAPDIIIGSWCGKRFRPERVQARAGWEAIPAVRDGAIYEIKSADILQPGPAALTDGVRRLQHIVKSWAQPQA